MTRYKGKRKPLILLIWLIIMTGFFSMPWYAATADAATANAADTGSDKILSISQRVEEESGRLDRDDYTFKYRLSAEGSDYPLPEGARGLSWDFELTGDSSVKLEFLTNGSASEEGTMPLSFESTGVYHYILEQTGTGELVNVSYDRSVYDIYVQVFSEQSAGLKVGAVWVTQETGEKPDSLVFVNSVRKSTVIGDPPVMIQKRIEGDPVEDDKFVFVMTPEQEDYPLPEGARGKFEKTLYGEGEVEMGNIPFSAPGTYRYTIKEKDDPLLNYQFDKSEYRVTYMVTEEKDGSLSCTREIKKENSSEEKCVFTNIYSGKKLDTDRTSGSPDQKPDDPEGNSVSQNKGGGADPNTGDVMNLAVYLVILIIAAVLICAAFIYKRRP